MATSTLTLVFQTGGALPTEGVSFTVKRPTGEVLYEGEIAPASSGISEPIVLSAPARELSLVPDSTQLPYAVYDVEARATGYYDTAVYGVQIFADSPSRQTVNLIPLPNSREPRGGKQVYQIPPHALRLQETSRKASGDARILEKVVVPEKITVHLGAPNSFARNVTVPFVDYIKNVASSEIYPTWPEESLRANILAQISLALNRIYTEWYPARGYSFNITNSTAYDQYFVYGRNVFDSVSRLADELFSTYLVKPGREEPFYAEYCNGSTVACPGMSQWGTVALAQDGLVAKQILEFYYGDINVITTDNIAEVPESYPGVPLTLGASGEKVLNLQIQLDRIAINYPAIPLVFADGVFGPNTQAAVRAFQRIANLSADGVVGRATWYAVSHYYVAVKKLAELASEGELPAYNDFRFPGILRRGSRGTSVQTVQFFLNTLAEYNPEIPSERIDGIFGAATERAVSAAQSFLSLAVDGIVGKETWDALVDAYRGAQNVPVPPEELVTRPYPGSLVRRGQSGANVRYVQESLNRIGEVFAPIVRLSVDGVFGGATEGAVRSFQRLFGLSADGIVGEQTWNRLNEVRIAAADCLFESDEAAYTRPYPGSLVRRGQSGANVRYVQNSLNVISRVLVTLPRLSADGVFGGATEGAVRSFQSLFGLSADGIVGERTWRQINYLLVAVTDGCLSPRLTEAIRFEQARAADEKEKAPLRLGAFSEEVLAYKRRLCEKLGVPTASLGDNLLFGLATRRATERYQHSAGLAATGEADEGTLKSLGL